MTAFFQRKDEAIQSCVTVPQYWNERSHSTTGEKQNDIMSESSWLWRVSAGPDREGNAEVTSLTKGWVKSYKGLQGWWVSFHILHISTGEHTTKLNISTAITGKHAKKCHMEGFLWANCTSAWPVSDLELWAVLGVSAGMWTQPWATCSS